MFSRSELTSLLNQIRNGEKVSEELVVKIERLLSSGRALGLFYLLVESYAGPAPDGGNVAVIGRTAVPGAARHEVTVPLKDGGLRQIYVVDNGPGDIIHIVTGGVDEEIKKVGDWELDVVRRVGELAGLLK